LGIILNSVKTIRTTKLRELLERNVKTHKFSITAHHKPIQETSIVGCQTTNVAKYRARHLATHKYSAMSFYDEDKFDGK